MLKAQLASRYDLGAIADCDVVGQSFNDVYRVEAESGRFVLRVSGVLSQAATGIAYELAVFRWWQRFTGQPREYWTAYLNAYQEHRRLGPADLASIPLFVAVRHIRLLGAGVWLAGTGGWRPDDEYFDRRLLSLDDWLAENTDLRPGTV